MRCNFFSKRPLKKENNDKMKIFVESLVFFAKLMKCYLEFLLFLWFSKKHDRSLNVNYKGAFPFFTNFGIRRIHHHIIHVLNIAQCGLQISFTFVLRMAK
jgi:hypothetical protein